MSLKYRILDAIAKTIDFILSILLKESHQVLLKAFFIEKLSPVLGMDTGHGKIDFYCPNILSTRRAQTLLSKEPETIEWIDTFGKNDIFWDIGANIGCYTLYAAKRNIKTFAFEPSAYNYYLLNKNIEINDLSDKSHAYCIAFSDEERAGLLNMTETEMGGSVCEFGGYLDKVDIINQHWPVMFKQGMTGFSIDKFIDFFHMEIPNHIKIDVDGLEDRIIEGAGKTLKNTELKSLLIELDENQKDYAQSVISQVESSGMKLKEKRHAPMYDNSEWSSIYNYIFERI